MVTALKFTLCSYSPREHQMKLMKQYSHVDSHAFSVVNCCVDACNSSECVHHLYMLLKIDLVG